MSILEVRRITHVSPLTHPQAILGAGPAGICTARALRARGHKPIIFEAAPDFGFVLFVASCAFACCLCCVYHTLYLRGLWGSRPINPALYDSLRTNLPTVLMKDSSLPFPHALRGTFVDKDALSDYIRALSENLNLRGLTRFNTRVIKVTPQDLDPSETGAWTVQYTTTDSEHGSHKTATESFDGVAVATGHYNAPYMPSLPGQDDWLKGGDGTTPRRIMHAMQYRNAAEFRGRSVLVVGMRSSGTDISREISSEVSQLYALDKGCKRVKHVGRCVHVPRDCRLRTDGRLELPDGGLVWGEPIDTIILATGSTMHMWCADAKAKWTRRHLVCWNCGHPQGTRTILTSLTMRRTS